MAVRPTYTTANGTMTAAVSVITITPSSTITPSLVVPVVNIVNIVNSPIKLRPDLSLALEDAPILHHLMVPDILQDYKEWRRSVRGNPDHSTRIQRHAKDSELRT
jgi:hypothetical protein